MVEGIRNNAGHCKLKIYKDKQRMNLMKTVTIEESKTNEYILLLQNTTEIVFEVRLIYLEIQWDYQMVSVENVSVFFLRIRK